MSLWLKMAEVAQCGNTSLYLSPSKCMTGNEACQERLGNEDGGILGNRRGEACVFM